MKIDKLLGVSQRLPISLLENVVSNAERCLLLADESVVVPLITEISRRAAGYYRKFELEYEGELRGLHNVACDVYQKRRQQCVRAPADILPRPPNGSTWGRDAADS